MVRLLIRNITDRRSSVNLDVDPSTTISELKVLIAKAYQASSERMELIFRSTKLIDSETISSSNISDDSTLLAYLHSPRSSSSPDPSVSVDGRSSFPAGPSRFPSTHEPSLSAHEFSSFRPEPPISPPPPPPSSTSAVLGLDDPSIPDWVRNPVEKVSIFIKPHDVQQLVEMGFSVRQARNALRIAHGDLQQAASMTEYVETEADNQLIERVMLEGSGLSAGQRTRDLMQLMSRKHQRPERPSYEMEGSSFLEQLFGLPERRTQRAEPVLSITPGDIAPFLSGSNADLQARVRERFPGNNGKVVIEVLEFLRNAISETPSEFINPFALLGVSGTIGNQIFGENFAFTARLNTEECQWLLTRWRDGKDFVDLCEVLDAAESNLETADQLLTD
jgi:hypothetical protein